jgi:hypothetical protein
MASSSLLDTRSLALTVLTAVLGGLLLLPSPVLAQTQHKMMVFDDGAGPQVVHFSGPDLRELLQPDFERKDLPVFNRRLDLDDMQRLVVEVLLGAYLDAFKMLSEEVLPEAPSPMLGMAMGAQQGADGEGSESIDSIVRDAIRESGGASDVDLEMEGQGTIAIAIEARGAFGEDHAGHEAGPMDEEFDVVWAGAGEEGEAPESEVFIAVAGPDDFELSPELQEKLAEKAREMAERIRERLEQAEAEGIPLSEEIDAAGEADQRQQYFDELREGTKKLEKAKAALKQDFINEVQSQLSAEQLEQWPGLERALTRIKTLPKGRLDGERTDLLRIVENLDLDESEQRAVAETLEAYELQLHEALVARNAFVGEAQSKVDKAIEEGRFSGAISTVNQASRLRVAVRGVNEQFTDTITGRLDPGTGKAFQSRVRLESYPRVYRMTRGQKSFAAARRLDGLDDDVHTAIDAIEDAYAAELKTANERLREAIHRHQPREARQMIERIQAMMEDGEPMSIGGDDDPIRAATRKRTDLDERYMKQLYALLTPEQVKTLPKLPSQISRDPIIIRSLQSPG